MSDPLVGPSPPVLTSQLKQIIERPDLDAAVWRRAVVGGGEQTKRRMVEEMLPKNII